VRDPPTSESDEQERSQCEQSDRERIRLRSFHEDPGCTLDALVGCRTFEQSSFEPHAAVVAPRERIEQGVELPASGKVDREGRSRHGGHERVSSFDTHAMEEPCNHGVRVAWFSRDGGCVMKITGSVAAAVLTSAIGACSHEGPQNASPNGAQELTGVALRCPVNRFNGVSATVEDIHDGVAISFTGPQPEVSKLRQNVHRMDEATTQGEDPFAVCPCADRSAQFGSTEAMPVEGSGRPDFGTTLPVWKPQSAPIPTDSSVDEIPAGAVLKLKAKQNGRVEELRRRILAQVVAIQDGCLVKD